MEMKVKSRMFICSFPDCPVSYDKRWKLEAHLCKHTGVRPFECKYEGCSKSFTTKSHLSRHNLTHTGERPYKCSEDGCAEAFTTSFNLKKHVSRKHKLEVKQYICKFEGCDKSFKKNNQLKIHECTHTLQLPYVCSYEGCEKRFPNPSKQKRHEKVHKGYPCTAEECSFVGKTWTELTKHKKEHKVMVQCSECERNFRDCWFLQQHQRVHSEVRQVFRCPREGCTRSYTTPFNLQSHILSFHEEQRAFTCLHPGCSKTFSMKQSLLRHGVAHDPERKKLKKPRPKRSLASRLSGYNPPRRSRRETSEPSETAVKSELKTDKALNSSESVTDVNHNSTSETYINEDCRLLMHPLLESESSDNIMLQLLESEDDEISNCADMSKDKFLLKTPVSKIECRNVLSSQSDSIKPISLVADTILTPCT